MQGLEPLLNFGGLGVAVAVLVLFGRQLFDRVNEASRFTEQLGMNAISSIQEISRESAAATRAQTEALTRLCLVIDELRGEMRDGHDLLLREIQRTHV